MGGRVSRTSGRRYRFDCEEAEHVELLELLKTLPTAERLAVLASVMAAEAEAQA